MLNKNLKRLREEKGLTQIEVGKAANATAKTVMNWESGKTEPKASELIALSKKLGTSINEIIGSEESEQSKLIAQITHAIDGLSKEEINSLMIMVEALYLRNQSHKIKNNFSLK